MAKPPSCAAENPASAPESLPIGVRAPARITEPAIKGPPQGVERVRRFYGAPCPPPIAWRALVALLGLQDSRFDVAAGADAGGGEGPVHRGADGAGEQVVKGLALHRDEEPVPVR